MFPSPGRLSYATSSSRTNWNTFNASDAASRPDCGPTATVLSIFLNSPLTDIAIVVPHRVRTVRDVRIELRLGRVARERVIGREDDGMTVSGYADTVLVIESTHAHDRLALTRFRSYATTTPACCDGGSVVGAGHA